MSIELRLRSVTCNIACTYCYQNAERKANNYPKTYDLDNIFRILEERKQEFTLFGGEPLMLPLKDLERVFEWGFHKFGRNTIQTNGILIKEVHIEMFRKYKVHVGISIDGPGELNDVRWQRSLEQTRKNTAIVERVIAELCHTGLTPSLIVTLHRGNACKERLPVMEEWMRTLDSLGISSVRLHLLEVDEEAVREEYALTAEENTEALLTFIQLEKTLKNIRFDLTSDMRALLLGKDESASCVWRACDPFHTLAVSGLEGNGNESKCGRVNKEGIDYLRPDKISYERYVNLYLTEDKDGGCKSCRFFLMCKGQCPGTGIEGDWRKKSEHCRTWKALFSYVEEQLVLEGHTPLSLHPARKRLERQMVAQWKNGRNPTISRLAWKAPETEMDYHVVRQVWLNKETKSLWAPRFASIQHAIQKIETELKIVPADYLKLRQSYGIEVPEETQWQKKIALEAYIALGNSMDLTEEMSWLELLMTEAPVLTSVNGISESKTSLMKLVTHE